MGDGVWLWGVLKALIDPNHEITVIQLILSILTFKQSALPFTVLDSEGLRRSAAL